MGNEPPSKSVLSQRPDQYRLSELVDIFTEISSQRNSKWFRNLLARIQKADLQNEISDLATLAADKSVASYWAAELRNSFHKSRSEHDWRSVIPTLGRWDSDYLEFF
jgi:hypothetical protein